MRPRDRVAVALVLALLTMPLVPAQPADAAQYCVRYTKWAAGSVSGGVIEITAYIKVIVYDYVSGTTLQRFDPPRTTNCVATISHPKVVDQPVPVDGNFVTDAFTQGRAVLLPPIPPDITPSLTFAGLPDTLRVGTAYGPTAKLADGGRPLSDRLVWLMVGSTRATARTDQAGNATFAGFTPRGETGAVTGLLWFEGDPVGGVRRTSVQFIRTILPADPAPSPPTGLAARFITAGLTELRWNAPAGGPMTYFIRLNGGYEWSMTGTSWQGLYQPGTYTLEVRARDSLGRFSDYARLGFTQPAAPTSLSNWVWQPVPAHVGSFVSTRADLTWTLPASVYAQPGSGTLAGWPLTFSLGPQSFAGGTSSFTTQTVQAGPGTLPTSVAFAGGSYYAPARLTGTLEVVANDTTPPSMPVVIVTPSVNTSNLFTLRATSTDELRGSGVKQFDWSVDGQGYFSSVLLQNAQPIGAMTYGPAPLSSSFGRHTVQVRARDAAGNISSPSAPVSFEWRQGQAHWDGTRATVNAACSGGTPVGTVTVRGVLQDQDNKPLAGRYVTIAGGGGPGSAMTAADGSATFAGRTGTAFTLGFPGDSTYAAASAPVTASAQPPCLIQPRLTLTVLSGSTYQAGAEPFRDATCSGGTTSAFLKPFRATLVDERGAPLAGRMLIATFGGQSASGLTDASGVFAPSITGFFTAAALYPLAVMYPGDAGARGATTATWVNVPNACAQQPSGGGLNQPIPADQQTTGPATPPRSGGTYTVDIPPP